MRSAITPWINGTIAPPTIAIFRMPDALPVKGPSSATPRLKIVGNMMELKNPTARMLHMAKCPCVSIDRQTSDEVQIANVPKRCPALTFLIGPRQESARSLPRPNRTTRNLPHSLRTTLQSLPVRNNSPGNFRWRLPLLRKQKFRGRQEPAWDVSRPNRYPGPRDGILRVGSWAALMSR